MGLFKEQSILFFIFKYRRIEHNIESEIKSIKAEMPKNSFENFRKRLGLVISAERRHIENNNNVSYVKQSLGSRKTEVI